MRCEPVALLRCMLSCAGGAALALTSANIAVDAQGIDIAKTKWLDSVRAVAGHAKDGTPHVVRFTAGVTVRISTLVGEPLLSCAATTTLVSLERGALDPGRIDVHYMDLLISYPFPREARPDGLRDSVITMACSAGIPGRGVPFAKDVLRRPFTTPAAPRWDRLFCAVASPEILGNYLRGGIWGALQLRALPADWCEEANGRYLSAEDSRRLFARINDDGGIAIGVAAASITLGHRQNDKISEARKPAVASDQFVQNRAAVAASLSRMTGVPARQIDEAALGAPMLPANISKALSSMALNAEHKRMLPKRCDEDLFTWWDKGAGVCRDHSRSTTPQARFGQEYRSGGAGVHVFDFSGRPRDGARLRLMYEFFTLPDRIVVEFVGGGGRVLDTGMVSGSGALDLPAFTGRSVRLVVTGGAAATAWRFTIADNTQ